MHRCHQIYKFIFLFCFFALPAFAGQFLVGTEDVPLMSGMSYCEDETFSFDNEDGRLYFSKTLISEDPKEIWAFYRASLFQLGWVERSTGLFERDDETLKISIEDLRENTIKKSAVIFELITKSK